MKITDKYVFFYTNKDIFSQHYPCNFSIHGKNFTTSEQYMMWRKAMLFNDYDIAQKILNTNDPVLCKQLGRNVKNYNDVIWSKERFAIVVFGNLEKFRQNKSLYKELEKNKDKIFAEASPTDVVWGIGSSINDDNIEDETTWKGNNLLGKALNLTATLLFDKTTKLLIDIDKNKTISFTGHRPEKIGGYDKNNELNKWVNNELEKFIIKSFCNGYRTFITGGALGTDQNAAQIVLKYKNRYPGIIHVLAKPFASQAIKWREESKKDLEYIENNSDCIVNVSIDGYEAWKMQKRNQWMVDHSDIVCAVYNGDESGGTFNCVQYAKNVTEHIFQINPKDKKTNWLK